MLVHGKDTPTFARLSDVADHSAWRQFMAERIAAELDYETYGVREVYLIGSTETGQAGVGSDIDLLVHIEENPEKQRRMLDWLDGWSRSLALANYLRTGYMTDRLLDIHLVTDNDVGKGDSFAMMMQKTTESSRLTSRK